MWWLVVQADYWFWKLRKVSSTWRIIKLLGVRLFLQQINIDAAFLQPSVTLKFKQVSPNYASSLADE